MAFTDRLHNRGSISTGYDIEYSNKFESDAGEGIIRNYDASQGANCIANNSTTNAKKFTVSYWVKKTELLASGQNIPWIAIAGGNATVVKFQDEKFAAYDDSAGWSLATNALFRDTSAWYHLVCAVDTTQSTASDRVNLYVNGVLQTSFSTENYGTQNNDNQLWKVNTGHQIGNQAYFKGGYIAELHCIDGTQYAASDFGKYDDSGIWIPKEADVTYGDQGYYLNWSDFGSANSNANNTGVGKDHSGNTNPFVNLANWSSADIATDTPTNNFATINTLQGNSSKLTITNGATSIVKSGNYGWQTTAANIAVTVGKWYAEFKLDTSCTTVMLGVNQADNEGAWNGSHIGVYSNSIAQGMGYYSQNGYFYRNGGSGAIANTYTAGDIIGIAFCYNSDGTAFMGMSKNGSWQNSQDPSSGTTNMLGLNYGNSLPANTPYTFAISTHESAGGVLANFGGLPGFTISSANTDADGYGSFEYAVPTGYYALCTKNLAEYG